MEGRLGGLGCRETEKERRGGEKSLVAELVEGRVREMRSVALPKG
jgi:hypothetical protein